MKSLPNDKDCPVAPASKQQAFYRHGLRLAVDLYDQPTVRNLC
ncbi:hypothetical protein M107_1511 [Bacteroides fragilis str. 3725 D9(v)]|nr:hypothetical protein M107_1511 [Bacteroides fragilis str. 3725 D9(v)]EYA00526.1 hypothetical protein M087_1835 [Bacteroides fragilis str. S23 R14]EYA66638.1 hypothetical protein M139_1982 [Bacteroides fragilis str. S23L24]